MSASNAMRMPLTEVLKRSGSTERLRGDDVRRYTSDLQMRTFTDGKGHYSSLNICYEIGYRGDVSTTRSGFKGNEWRGWLVAPKAHGDNVYNTPEAVKAALVEVKPKHAFIPSWETFNFDGIVYVLGAMLSTLSVYPDLRSSEFMAIKDMRVRGVNQSHDMHAVMDTGAVFIHNGFSALGRGNALWTMVLAANIAGSTAVLLTADCDGNGAPVCQDLAGRYLVEGVQACLATLGGIYSIAGLGDVFGVCLTKGMHTVMTVVGHSDEGGFMRDVLRCGGFSAPFGGIPQHIAIAAGIPLVDGGSFGQIVGLVDSILLATAALVAHCDPTDEHDGDIFPTVLKAQGEPVTGVTIAQGWAKEHQSGLLYPFENFSELYAEGLSKLFGLASSANGQKGATILTSSFSAMCADKNPANLSRHLQFPVVAPFYWVEPTTILPSKFLGTRAEEGGVGSLVGWNECIERPFLPSARASGAVDIFLSEWNIAWRSLRTWPGYLFLSGHRKDGAGFLQMKGFDSESIVLSKITPEEIYSIKKNRGHVDPGDLCWVRGQCKIPHPAEALNIDGTLALSILHREMDRDRNAREVRHIPRGEIIHKTMVTFTCSSLACIANGKIGVENYCIQRERSRGVRALELCRSMSQQFNHGCTERHVATERPPPKELLAACTAPPPPVLEVDSNTINAAHPVECDVGQAPLAGESKPRVSCNAPISRQQGAIVAPQPRGMAQTNPPTTGMVTPADGLVTPGDGGNPANAHGQAAAAVNQGAAAARP